MGEKSGQTPLKNLEQKLSHESKKLALLFEIGKEFISSLSTTEVLSAIVKRVCQVLGVEICSILLVDSAKDQLYIAAAKGLPEDVIAHTKMKKGEKISGWVWANQKSLLVEDIEKDSRFMKATEQRYYTGSFISAPLLFKDKVVGVINVNNKRSREVFTQEELWLIEGIADHASIAIENSRLYKNLQGVYLQIIAALTSIIEVKDHYTRGHSERVTQYAVAIATALKFKKTRVELIKLACGLHDVGKIAISEAILTKPGRLTEEEWEEIKLHPLKAVEILKPLAFLNEVITLVLEHHEHYDGSGYPQGKKADEITMGARIINIADSFDAMTTERPYARALSFEEAIEELHSCSGTQFDPQIVKVFIELLKQDFRQFKK